MINKRLRIFVLLIIIFLFGFIAFLLAPSQNVIGTGDFRPYWSATYLLSQGKDFSNLNLMDQVERQLTGWDEQFTMMAWFAPTGMFVLLPFTILPFEKAAFLWLLINILILSVTAIILWDRTKQKIWVPLLIIFCFPMTLLSLYVGQINILVLFGLAVYISLSNSKYQYLRGVCLALITIKPHLVILTLPLIILDCLSNKRWKVLIGFFGSILFSSIILTLFYPPWLLSFWKLITSGMSSIRETPTLSGVIAFITGKGWGRWIWVLGIILLLIIWTFKKENWKIDNWVYLSIPLSLIVSPIGWGYDQIILLIPLLFLHKVVLKEKVRKLSIILSLFTISIYIIILVMRVLNPNEVWFFFVPFLFLFFYLYLTIEFESIFISAKKTINLFFG